eukprot:TRINITY_DN31059_c0_g1_i1.p1 TRINITY_DN31059_c0_g1~~TRINITY_DN31059_c0_g1_i1.p1  ORF type:complete len:705 (-),score=81.47 TRINITY_DN31059_c0_g1_i1:25-2022(-)
MATAAVLHWARWTGKPASTDRRQTIKRFSIHSIPSSEHVVCWGDENEHCHRNLVRCLGNFRLEDAVADCQSACDEADGYGGGDVDTLETCSRLFQEKRRVAKICLSKTEGTNLVQFPDELRELATEMESLQDEMSQCLTFTSSITMTTSMTITTRTISSTTKSSVTETMTSGSSTTTTSISTSSTSVSTQTTSTMSNTSVSRTTSKTTYTTTSVTQTITSTKLPTRQHASKGSPNQIRLKSDVDLCLTTPTTLFRNGEPVHLARCEYSEYTTSGPHEPLCKPLSASTWWLIDEEDDKIYLAANPRFCLSVKDNYNSDGTPLQLWECTSPEPSQDFEVSSKIRWATHSDKCLTVNSASGAPASIESCRESDEQEFVFHDRQCPQRRASFLVLGDWGWDAAIHGKALPANRCQRAIADLMLVKMEELGDVKFVINVGDSFYPDGLNVREDPQWDVKWRNIYAEKLRSVPWYSVYGNHDYHHDPGACSSDPADGLQINADIDNKDFFYMPDYTYFVEHRDLDLEVLGMDTNNLVIGECSRSRCPAKCQKHLRARANQSMELFHRRLRESPAKNFITFSHYPSDFFWRDPAFLNRLRSTQRDMAYFGGHRHNTDQITTARTGPHDWLVGGGGGWSCDGMQQGFVVVEIDQSFDIRSYPVIVPPSVCCLG